MAITAICREVTLKVAHVIQTNQANAVKNRLATLKKEPNAAVQTVAAMSGRQKILLIIQRRILQI